MSRELALVLLGAILAIVGGWILVGAPIWIALVDGGWWAFIYLGIVAGGSCLGLLFGYLMVVIFG